MSSPAPGPRHAAAITVPGSGSLAITATDWISIGTAGNLIITTLGGETVTVPLPVGMFPIRATAIWSGSTAAGIVAWWD